MRIRTLPGTDLRVSQICFGTGNFGERIGEKDAFTLLDAFVDGGGNFIDTANVYCRWVSGKGNSSEQYIGKWLKSRNAYDRVVIATKGGHYDFARPEVSRVREQEIRKDAEESLGTLGLERIDFYWLHRDDPSIPMEEILGWMERLKDEGKIRYYGASNYSQKRMEEAVYCAAKKGITGFSAVSNQWSLASVNPGSNPNPDLTLHKMTRDFYRWHEQTGMPMIPYSSGAQGFFGKLLRAGVRAEDGKILETKRPDLISENMMHAYGNERNFRIYERLCKWSQRTGIDVHTLSLMSLTDRSFPVFPVVAASSLSQMEGLLRAGEQIPDGEEREQLRECEVE